MLRTTILMRLFKAIHIERLLLVLLIALIAAYTAQAQSALDGFDPSANGLVNVVVVQPDGKILIGGQFSTLAPNGGATVTRNRIARLNPDGTLDTAFNPNANNAVNSIALQPDGKILVGGGFSGANSIGGQTRNRIARLDPVTGLADSFNPNANNFVLSIVVQADGKVLAGGSFTSIGGQQRNRIARLDAVTGLADSFDPNATDQVRSITFQADGRILVGGDFLAIGGQTRNRIARLDAATGLSDSFDPNANAPVWSITVQPDGKILVGGTFVSIGGQTRSYIARLDASTGLADSFNPNANSFVYVIAVQADGNILVGGSFTNIGGQPRNRIARLDAVTGLAESFAPNANDTVRSIAVQPDGKILAGGVFTTLSPNGGAAVTRNNIARIETDGRLDQTLNLSAIGTLVLATAIQPDGKILIGGIFSSVLGQTRNNVARLNADGTLDLGFNPNANNQVRAFTVLADGRILVGGIFTNIGGQPRNRMARLDAITGAADTFDPNANNTIGSIAVQPDGKIIVSGSFTSVGGQTRNRIARLDGTTGLADGFDPNANNLVHTVVIQPDGKILVGGSFTNIGGQTRNNIARLDGTSGLVDTFDPNANNIVLSIVMQSDGKILAGGFFTNIGGQTRGFIARLDGTSGLADTFNPNAVGTAVQTIVAQSGGKVLAGGVFNTVGGQPRNNIARLDGATGLADSFNPNANSDVIAIALQADGKVLVGGNFTNIGGQTLNFFARLTNDTAALQNLAVTLTSVIWTLGGSSPQFTRVTFESSTDNLNYTPLGSGTPAGGNWAITGLNLPTGQNIYIRARGYYHTGYQNGSESITESVRNAFIIAGPPLNCTPIPIDYGQSVGGNLNSGSCGINGPTDRYTFTGTAGQNIAISLDSLMAGGIQPTLELVGNDGTTVIASNSGAVNARIPANGFFPLPPSSGSYTIRASTSPGNFGNYSLSLTLQPAGPGCTYTVSPAVTFVSPTPGSATFSFDVLSGVGCPTVTAANGVNSGHITIITNSGGRVTFSVAAYGGTTDRTGTIIVNNGEAVQTITQFGILAPENDLFALAQILTPGFAPITVNGRNTNASFETNEPAHAGSTADHSVWYRWTAPTSDLYSFTTSGSDFDTLMAIYTGPSVGNLTPIAQNDDTTTFDQTSKINFRATAGTIYSIAIDGANGSSGSIVLSYRQYSRLYRLYLQNFNGFPTSIVPMSVTAIRQDGQGPTINGTLISLGVYEFDLPNDHLPYIVTISGPAGITWQPSTYLIDITTEEYDELMQGPTVGGQNQTSNPTNTTPQHFFGFIHGISTLQSPTLQLHVEIASTGSSSAVPPYSCGPPTVGTSPLVLVTGGPGGTLRVRYDCLTQPNTTHQIVPNALQTAFAFPVLPLPSGVVNSTHLPTSSEAITATSASTFNISGQVRDGTNGLSGVTIDVSTGVFTLRVTSDTNGNYLAENLAPGVYTLRATSNSYVFLPEMVTLTSANETRDIPAVPCSYLFTGEGNFSGFGGQGEFAVTQQISSLAVIGTQCTWTAERGSDWVSVLSSSNLGDGTVQFSVKPNPGTSRQSTINIGGQGFVITQEAGFPITGTITYGNTPSGAPTPRFVSNVLINGVGLFGVSTVSGFPDGAYSLAGFGSGGYTVTPSKTGGVNGAISSFDAGRIALHVAGPPNPQLNPTQLIVADVSGNGSVTSFDAGMIAKFVAGPPYEPPGIGQTATWKFSPVSRTYPIVNTTISGQDYSALLMGEVSGNWNPATHPRPSPVGSRQLAESSIGSERSTAVELPQMTALTDMEIIIPVNVQGAANKGIISYEFNLRYDPTVVQPMKQPVDVAGTVSRGLI